MMKNSILVYYLESVVVRGAGRLLVVADVLEVLLPDEGAHCAPPGGHVGGAVGGVGVLGTRLVHQDVNLVAVVLSVFLCNIINYIWKSNIFS